MCSLSTSSMPGSLQPPVRHTEFPLSEVLFLRLLPTGRPWSGQQKASFFSEDFLDLHPHPGRGRQASKLPPPEPAPGPARGAEASLCSWRRKRVEAEPGRPAWQKESRAGLSFTCPQVLRRDLTHVPFQTRVPSVKWLSWIPQSLDCVQKLHTLTVNQDGRGGLCADTAPVAGVCSPEQRTPAP